MMQVQKYPPRTIFDFSKTKNKHEILLHIKYTKTKQLFFKRLIFFKLEEHKYYLI
jgi:hypothetical protein